jgi:hypothetical protein
MTDSFELISGNTLTHTFRLFVYTLCGQKRLIDGFLILSLTSVHWTILDVHRNEGLPCPHSTQQFALADEGGYFVFSDCNAEQQTAGTSKSRNEILCVSLPDATNLILLSVI